MQPHRFGFLICASSILLLVEACGGDSTADRKTTFEQTNPPGGENVGSTPRGDNGNSSESTAKESSPSTGKPSYPAVGEWSGGEATGSGTATSGGMRAGAGAGDGLSAALPSPGGADDSASGSSAVLAPETPKPAADAGVEAATPTPVAPADPLRSRLTAGVWDDNANFDVFVRYLTAAGQSYAARLPQFPQLSFSAARDSYAQRRSFDAIDIALMLDTTGSMGDEISYLQMEFIGISQDVAQRFPNTDVRWSLVAYRDTGDRYVTLPFDFTTNVEAFRTNLAQQGAEGGGDEPEAVAAAFEVTLGQSWRGSGAAQMVLWVADAPHHDNDAESVRGSIGKARDKGIRVYPVASSNANPLAEATMRVAAQYTGGRYLFLTDDSGIGGSHAEPKVPCYYVTRFRDAIVRSIGMELTGRYVPPSEDAIVRVVGTPLGASCAGMDTADAGDTLDAALDAALEAAAEAASEADTPHISADGGANEARD